MNTIKREGQMSMSLSGSMSVPEFIEVEGWTSPSPVVDGWTSNPGYVFNAHPVIAPPSEIADPFQEYKRTTDEKISNLEKALSEKIKDEQLSQNRDKETSCKLKLLDEKTSYLDVVKDKRWHNIDQYLSEQKKERQEMKDEITLLKKGVVGKINSLEKVMLVEQKKLREEITLLKKGVVGKINSLEKVMLVEQKKLREEITLLKKDKACMMGKINSLKKELAEERKSRDSQTQEQETIRGMIGDISRKLTALEEKTASLVEKEEKLKREGKEKMEMEEKLKEEERRKRNFYNRTEMAERSISLNGGIRYTETLNPNTIIFIKNPLLKVLFIRIDCLFRRCLVPLRTPLNITHT
jgi:hypothetical protein